MAEEIKEKLEAMKEGKLTYKMGTRTFFIPHPELFSEPCGNCSEECETCALSALVDNYYNYERGLPFENKALRLRGQYVLANTGYELPCGNCEDGNCEKCIMNYIYTRTVQNEWTDITKSILLDIIQLEPYRQYSVGAAIRIADRYLQLAKNYLNKGATIETAAAESGLPESIVARINNPNVR